MSIPRDRVLALRMEGHSLQQIADQMGVRKAYIWRICGHLRPLYLPPALVERLIACAAELDEDVAEYIEVHIP